MLEQNIVAWKARGGVSQHRCFIGGVIVLLKRQDDSSASLKLDFTLIECNKICQDIFHINSSELKYVGSKRSGE